MTHTIHNWSSSSLFRNITQSQLSAQSTSQKTPHALEVVLLRYGKQLQSQKQLNLNVSFHWNFISGIARLGISSIASGKNVSFTFQSPWRRITKDTQITQNQIGNSLLFSLLKSAGKFKNDSIFQQSENTEKAQKYLVMPQLSPIPPSPQPSLTPSSMNSVSLNEASILQRLGSASGSKECSGKGSLRSLTSNSPRRSPSPIRTGNLALLASRRKSAAVQQRRTSNFLELPGNN